MLGPFLLILKVVILAKLNETPAGNRIHICILGRMNSGKSSFINAFTNQNISIVSDVLGTTTDPVYKSMEINPIGPCVIIDTPGFDDDTELGRQRIDKTLSAIDKADIAVLVISVETFLSDSCDLLYEKKYVSHLKKNNTPFLIIINKIDLLKNKYSIKESEIMDSIYDILNAEFGKEIHNNIFLISSDLGLEREKIDDISQVLQTFVSKYYKEKSILGTLVDKGDSVMLVMPQDVQAPKGRLILPQVQTIRELLDKKCIITSVTADEYIDGLGMLKEPPKLIITDSQVFRLVYDNKPKESLLTSFSVLMAADKGDIDTFVEGSRIIDKLTEESKVLVAECCTHVPLNEDIGRVKIPKMLREKIGAGIQIDFVSGSDFERSLSGYDLIIHCGACMYNRKYVLSRMRKAKEASVPITNYGICIAKLSGILDYVVYPTTEQ